jgi:hypothetical protein
VVECDISNKVEWTSMADYMASSVAGSNSGELFLIGTPEGSRLCNPSEGLTENSRQDFKQIRRYMLRRIRKNAVRRTGVWLDMDGGRFEHLLQLRTAHGFSFDT